MPEPVHTTPTTCGSVKTSAAPGADDTAEFLGQAGIGGEMVNTNKPANWTGPAVVKKIVIGADYTSEIDPSTALTLTVTSGTDGGLFMYGDATIKGTGGSLTIDGTATFAWRAGNLQDLTITVNPSGEMYVPSLQQGSAGRTATNSTFEVKGKLDWTNGNVVVAGPARSEVHVQAGGKFNIYATGGTWGGTDRSLLSILNRGAVTLDAAGGVAALKGDYVSYGSTTLNAGTLGLGGLAEQGTGGTFRLSPGTIAYLTPPSAGGVGVLGIRDGLLTGTGSVQGTLVVGNDPPNQLTTTPIIQPDGGGGSGVILVTGDLTIFNGQVQVGISGPDVYDRVNVGGTAALGGKVVGVLQQAHRPIPAGTPINFLTAGTILYEFGTITLPDGILYDNSPTWDYGTNATTRWFVPKVDIPGQMGAIRGKVWDDDTGLARGVREPAAEGGLGGVPVLLYDSTGTTQIAYTSTAPDGSFSFDNVPAGLYLVEFGGYPGRRLAPQYATTDPAYDSDPDPATGQAPVYVTGEMGDIDAGYFTNAAPIAVDDDAPTPYDAPVDIDLVANDYDPDGDTLTVFWWTWPEYGYVSFSGGVATYTPPYGWTGTDTFSYGIDDGHGGYDYAVVTVDVVAPPPNSPPVAVDDTATTGTGTPVDIAVLPNDYDPDGDPLWVVSYTQPANGTVGFTDGVAHYTPDPGYTGPDSFSYTITDGRGGYATAAVYITVGSQPNNPPVAADDYTMTTAGTPINIFVLDNDSDPDGDWLTIRFAA